MAIQIAMPQLGESVVEGTIARWYVQPGDRVEAGQPLLEVETDKANAEVPSTEAGTVSKLLFAEGDVVAVGTVIVELTTGDEKPAAAPAPARAADPPAPPAPTPPAPEATKPASAPAPAPAPSSGGASTTIDMPSLGESVVEGTIVQWLVSPGDKVESGTLLVEVETDKANAEVPSPVAGTVLELLAKTGDVIAVGAPLVIVGDGSAAASPAAASKAPAAEPAPPKPSAPPAPPAPSAAKASPPPPPPAPSRASGSVPPADRMPWNNGGVLAAPTSGPPVSLPLAAPPAPPAAPAAAPVAASAPAGLPFGAPAGLSAYKPPVVKADDGDTVIPFNRRRAIIAEHMVYSKHVSPHVPCFAEVDMTAVSDLRRKHKTRLEKEDIPLTILAFVLGATVQALRENPGMNAVVGDQEIIQRKHVNLGVAVETDGGLVVPVIHKADAMSVGDLAKAVRDIAAKARDKKITMDDLSGGTFTVSNPGRKGNLFGAAIINQPQVGILRMGEIVRRPVVRTIEGEEVICIRSMMYLSLSYDHRIIDGVAGNGFLFRVRELLEQARFDV